MVIVLDANVWVSLLIVTETHHVVSDDRLRSWMNLGHRIVVPELFMLEVAGTISRRRNDPSAGSRALHGLRSEPLVDIVPLSPAVWTSAAEIAARHLLRGADAVYVALAADLGVPLITWDQELLAKAADVVDARTPEGLSS